MLRFKRSLCLQGNTAYMGLLSSLLETRHTERARQQFVCSNPKQQNLWETSKSLETAKSPEKAKYQLENW